MDSSIEESRQSMDSSGEESGQKTVKEAVNSLRQICKAAECVSKTYCSVACSGCCFFSWCYLLTLAVPVISLHLLYIPGLDKTWNSTAMADPNLYFALKLENHNKNQGIYYDPINVTIYDSPNRVHPIGNVTIPQFYQGCGKTAMKSGRVLLDHHQAELGAVFHLDVATSVRYKTKYPPYLISKRARVKVGAIVKVNDQGSILNPKKDVELKSAAAKTTTTSGFHFYGHVGVVLFTLLALLFT